MHKVINECEKFLKTLSLWRSRIFLIKLYAPVTQASQISHEKVTSALSQEASSNAWVKTAAAYSDKYLTLVSN